ncbi:PASTA domain-containing protein [Planobispora takensis]|uniref:PASTA domain-containing protein n=1 Tax=Planobispora takensis TaxID=1367882 RepID=A0A8J3WZE6_9ACTN|nr:PASTA domain-containing protein [Planobispora takensis]GII04717.1 hypothetical protein Pta02_67250 [Planobispora takensis]
MRLEEELAEAMEAHVAGVRATPAMGGAIRRRNRAHRLRFRTAGVALATAAVAGAVPVYLSLNAGPAATAPGPAAQPGRGTEVAVVRDVTVPDVVGLHAQKALVVLEAAGLEAQVEGAGGEGDLVVQQTPAAGEKVARGHVVLLTSAPPGPTENPDPTADPDPTEDPGPGDEPSIPNDLGDLGDGRRFGGVEFTYLPEGLQWGEGSVKDGFGKTSYSTWWQEAGLEPGMYSVQAVVYRGQAATELGRRMKGYRDQGARPVEIGGERVYIVRAGESVGRIEEGGTPTAVWTEGAGLAIEVMMSPDYYARLGQEKAEAELKEIVEGVVPGR